MMASTCFNAPRSSAYNSTWTPQLDYEVVHYRNCGNDQICGVKTGRFTTLQEAQRNAKDTLMSAVNDYAAAGRHGFYHNEIDLVLRGLVTGGVTVHSANGASEQVYECLSEVHIYAVKKPYEPFQSQMVLIDGQRPLPSSNCHARSTGGYNTMYNAMIEPSSRYLSDTMHPSRPYPTKFNSQAWPDLYGNDNYNNPRYSNHTHPSHYNPPPYSTPNPSGTFSQTRPPYPDRPNPWIPRTTTSYDETMVLSCHRSHTLAAEESANVGHSPRHRKSNRHSRHHGKHNRAHGRKKQGSPDAPGNALGEGCGVGETCRGRRHSSVEVSGGMKELSKSGSL